MSLYQKNNKKANKTVEIINEEKILETAEQGPNRSGKSRHGAPLRAIQTIEVDCHGLTNDIAIQILMYHNLLYQPLQYGFIQFLDAGYRDKKLVICAFIICHLFTPLAV